ncbi:MAG: hypothetical protein Q4D82_04635 [Neisseria sp.]|nr:hypothetical protein [Neisseria sp.]
MNGENSENGFEWEGRVYKNREHAKAVWLCNKAIRQGRERAFEQFGHINTKFYDEPPQPPLSGAQKRPSENPNKKLITGSQTEALKTVQRLCRQIGEMAKVINYQNAAFELDLPPLLLSEAAAHLMAIDEKIRAAEFAAKQLGVKPVTEHLKTAREEAADRRFHAA